MNVFADTSFWVAFVVTNDPSHNIARRALLSKHPVRIVTSEFVMVESLNFVSSLGKETRQMFVNLADEVFGPTLETLCVRQNENLLQSTLNLYRNRGDKRWSFVDCSSFVIMQERGIKDALTADHHFEQAGFTILLK